MTGKNLAKTSGTTTSGVQRTTNGRTGKMETSGSPTTRMVVATATETVIAIAIVDKGKRAKVVDARKRPAMTKAVMKRREAATDAKTEVAIDAKTEVAKKKMTEAMTIGVKREAERRKAVTATTEAETKEEAAKTEERKTEAATRMLGRQKKGKKGREAVRIAKKKLDAMMIAKKTAIVIDGALTETEIETETETGGLDATEMKTIEQLQEVSDFERRSHH